MIKLFFVHYDDWLLSPAEWWFTHSSEFEVVGHYRPLGTDEDVEDLIETIEAARPDIVLMDYPFSLVDLSSDFVIKLTNLIILTIPGQKIIMIADVLYPEMEILRRSFNAGAIADDYYPEIEMLRHFFNAGAIADDYYPEIEMLRHFFNAGAIADDYCPEMEMLRRSFNAGAIAYLSKCSNLPKWNHCIKEAAATSQFKLHSLSDSVLKIMEVNVRYLGYVNFRDREILKLASEKWTNSYRKILELMIKKWTKS
ncbi:hypothetical protein [Haliscomenobacter hydrossis]|uniref:Uncharacterized protein n=1 Tax=Haliscomenobacter hydrossis (strain ATCC 27775 / DSM 1100 / LMG 10767 / O) TaxID=760192 RepID=F4L7V5_HALH1|nr:hypothetical protein [Haliscomenobacter hydrossis]AEE54463.1 hypothetical protein Halhy_6647 [Haliscomenobacter hydrossis DSM 1100]